MQQTGPSPLQILMASPQPFVPETIKRKANIGILDESGRSLKKPRVMTLEQYKAMKAGKPYINSSSEVQEQTTDDTRRKFPTLQLTSKEVQSSSSEESTPEPDVTAVPESEQPTTVEEPVGGGKENVANSEHLPNRITESETAPSEESAKLVASIERVPEIPAKVEDPSSPEASRKRKSEFPTEYEQSPAKKSKILVEAPVLEKKVITPLRSLFSESKFVNISLGIPYKAKITKPANNVASKNTGSPPSLKTAQNEVKAAKTAGSFLREFPTKMQNFTAKGIPNKGLFCYRNSIIQALMHVPAIHDYLSKHNQPNGDKCPCPGTSCICCLLREFTNVHFSDEKGINKKQKALELIDKLLGGDFAKIGCRHEQQDADEYAIRMLDKAVEQQKKRNKKGRAALEKLLEITTTQEVICSNKNCKHRSQTKSHNTSLRAKMAGRSQAPVRLHDLVNDLGATETIKDYKCEKCGKLGAIIKRKFTKLPPALMVHVNRGGKTNFRGQAKKLNNWLQFEPEMFLQTSDGVSHNYVLRSVVSHKGSTLNSGHYVCFGRNPDRKTWSMCDDTTVQQIPETRFRGGKEGGPKFSAYILMYGKANNTL